MSMDTTKYKPYPAYKESGIEWLGEVPAHWEVKRLKYNLRLLTEKTDRRENPIALENIQSWSGRFIPTESVFEGEGIAFSPGDILFGKLRPYLAKAILTKFSGEAVGDFFVMRPSQDVNGNFILYQILNKDFISIIDGSTFGAKMPRVSWEFMSGMILAMPPDDEQQTIATFLSRETAKIDTLIAKQERLIELLQEKRTALISHAVTKGLNPDAPMKNSGVEWLGEVPEHWLFVAFRRILACPIINGIFKKKEDFGTGTLLVNVFDIYNKDFLVQEVKLDRVNCNAQEIASYEARQGDLFFVRSSLKMEGIAAVSVLDKVKEPAVFECHIIRARPDQTHVLSRYSVYFLNSQGIRGRMIAGSKVTTMTTIDQETILSTPFLLPPLEEQILIASYLDSETAKIDTLIAKSRQSIDLIKERRTALISTAVTGKIDVREVFPSVTPE